MNKEKAEFLLDRFEPMFNSFLSKNADARMHISVGDGWYFILYDMLTELDSLITKSYLTRNARIKIDFVQIKEKFGSLRAYYNATILFESKISKFFSKLNRYIATKLCKWGFSKQYWTIDRFRQKYLYQTDYERIKDIVAEAEHKSVTTCEVCGQPGKRSQPRNTHWIATLCPKHYNECQITEI